MPDRCGLNIANPDEAEKYPVICIGFMHASSRQLSIPPVCKGMHTTSLYTREASLCSTLPLLSRRLFNMYLSGHAPDKYTLTCEHFRRNAAKPGPQAGAKLSKASQR
mgnify:FL=1